MDKASKIRMETVIARDVISRRIQELGQQISQDLAGNELVVIGVLKGAFIFMSDLLRSLTIPAKIDFVRLKSYGQDTESSGQVTITKDVESDIEIRGRNVLVIEDIVDTGLTLDFLKKHLEQHGPKEVKICALVDKAGAAGALRGPGLRRLRGGPGLPGRIRVGRGRGVSLPAGHL